MRNILKIVGPFFIITLFLENFILLAEVPRRPFLFKDARGEIAQARARGEKEVLLVIASMPGKNSNVARLIKESSGMVQYQDDELDYLRALIPIDQLQSIVGNDDIHSIDLSIHDRSRAFGRAFAPDNLSDSRPYQNSSELKQKSLVWPPKLSDYPITNRYNPIKDVRAKKFLQNNPTYDGRGIKIAMIDMNTDPLLPELQDATSLKGETIPKIFAYGTALDVRVDDDGRWLKMEQIVEAKSNKFQFNDEEYIAPKNGTFRIAQINEFIVDSLALYGSSIEKDLNRDGNPEGSSRLFTVIWDKKSNNVWVDTDQDLKFNDEKALTDYDVRPEFGVLGKDDPDTDVRESIAFALLIINEKNLVSINMGKERHATLVVGAALANKGTDGRFDGVAPGAQLINISEGGSAYGQIESPIISVKKYGADVVYFEHSSNITRNYLLRDGRLVATVIYGRLIEKHQPIILSPTHNYPILGGIDDIVLAKGIIGVNGHESKDNFFTNHGVRVEYDDNLLITGGYGPMGNGAFKPDIISPSNYVSTSLGFLEGRAIAGLFQLPAGYTIAGGTSTATPTAAGAVALLLSAAKQNNIKYDPDMIKHAVTRGARWVPNISAHKQGNGVISVAGAWEILKKGKKKNNKNITIEGKASVKHSYSHLLHEPHRGEGLYERMGWKVGENQQREIILKRTSGKGSSMEFNIEWEGNENGTFSSQSTIKLPLNKEVQIPINILPKSAGEHTAHLTITHSDSKDFVYRMLFAIVAPKVLDSSNNYSIIDSVAVPRPGLQSYFYKIPEGAGSLSVELNWGKRKVSLATSNPDTRSVQGKIYNKDNGVLKIIHNPTPGVWEIRLSDIMDTREFDWQQAKKIEPVKPTKATLKIKTFALSIDEIKGNNEIAEENKNVDYWVTNQMAKFNGSPVTTAFGTGRKEKINIKNKEQKVFEVNIDPGSQGFMAKAYGYDDTKVDLDIYVFDCTEEKCEPAKVDADPKGQEIVYISNPKAGKWKIVIDAFSMDGESTSFEYLDAVFNPIYGTLNVLDMPQDRLANSKWIIKTFPWRSGTIPEGRMPFKGLMIKSDVIKDNFIPIDFIQIGQ